MGFWTFLHLCQIPRDVSFAKDIAALPLQLLWGKQGHLGCKNSHLLFERPNFRLENLWEWITKLATVHVDCLSNASSSILQGFFGGHFGVDSKRPAKEYQSTVQMESNEGEICLNDTCSQYTECDVAMTVASCTFLGTCDKFITNLINFWVCLVFFHVFPS